MAGMRGMGALGFQFVSAEAAQAWVHAYYNAFTQRPRQAVRLPDEPEHRRGLAVHVRRDRRGGAGEGRRLVVLPVRARVLRHARPGGAGEIKLWEEYLAYRDTPAGQKARLGGLIGSPATIRERLRKFEESNVDQVILLNQAGKNTHEDICSSLELFAKEVMPEFHDREPEHQEWKQAVLAGDIELEEIDTEPFATPRRKL